MNTPHSSATVKEQLSQALSNAGVNSYFDDIRLVFTDMSQTHDRFFSLHCWILTRRAFTLTPTQIGQFLSSVFREISILDLQQDARLEFKLGRTDDDDNVSERYVQFGLVVSSAEEARQHFDTKLDLGSPPKYYFYDYRR